MKTIFLPLLISFLLLSCGRKDDENTNPVSQLPPATTTGANTIGCLVNGEVFLPRQNNPLGPSAKGCYYQNVNNGWEFYLGFFNDRMTHVRGVHIETNKKELEQGKSYELALEASDNAFFASYLLGGGLYGGFVTDEYNKGNITITRLDKINHILSGTFWFNAKNPISGEVIKITDGRFDMQYNP